MGKLRRIVLAIGDVAGGHRSAANALKQALDARFGHLYETWIVDLFKVADPFPLEQGSDASFAKVASSPTYRLASDAFWYAHNAWGLNGLFNAYLRYKTVDAHGAALEALEPDVVVSIHPYISVTLNTLKRRGASFKAIDVVIDFAPIFRGWASPLSELVISPSAETSENLQALGVPAERIVGPLYPLRPSFQETLEKAPVDALFGSSSSQPVVLLLAGSLGAPAMRAGLAALAHRQDWRLVMICGRDEATRATLEREHAQHPHVKVLGFVKNIQDYMRQAEVVIAKPGTGTVMELEALSKKVVLVAPVGPQENGTLRYAESNPRFRLAGYRWSSLEGHVEALLRQPLSTIPDARRRLDGAFEIARAIDSIARPAEQGASTSAPAVAARL